MRINLMIICFHLRVFLAAKIAQEVQSVSLWRDTSSYWADRPSIILIDYSFMLFRSVKCHWSLVDGFFPASRVFSVCLLCSDPSINQSVKALSTAISHSGQDSGQDVHPHTRSTLPLALSSSMPNQRVRAVYHSGTSSKGNPDWGPFICLSQIFIPLYK